jgi:hypothetical protein
MKEERTGAVSLGLSAIERRTAREILRTSLEFEPVSMIDAISFKSVN